MTFVDNIKTKPEPTGQITDEGHELYKVFVPHAPEGYLMAKWSGAKPPPELGSRQETGINNIGQVKVLSYYYQHGFLGVHVHMYRPPTWMLKQNGTSRCHLFGCDFDVEVTK